MITSFRIQPPTLLRGMARAFDLTGSLGPCMYELPADPARADSEALMSDWQAVAGDVAQAYEQTTRYVREVPYAREGAYQE